MISAPIIDLLWNGGKFRAGVREARTKRSARWTGCSPAIHGREYGLDPIPRDNTSRSTLSWIIYYGMAIYPEQVFFKPVRNNSHGGFDVRLYAHGCCSSLEEMLSSLSTIDNPSVW